MCELISNPWDVLESEFPVMGTPAEQLRFLLNYAVLAPSRHNAQPWLFKVDGDTVELYADRSRSLPVMDPDDRELTIGCGAALTNLIIAIRHFGYTPVVQIHSRHDQPQLLARVAPTLLQTRFPIDFAAIEVQLERDGRWEGELVHTCKDGCLVIVESRQVLVRDDEGQPSAILEINRDSTERHKREQSAHTVYTEAAARLSFLQQVLDALPSGVYLVYGPDTRLLLSNRASARMWGEHWQVEQPMLEFLATNGIELVDTQGRPLPPEQYATLRAVRWGEKVLHRKAPARPSS